MFIYEGATYEEYTHEEMSSEHNISITSNARINITNSRSTINSNRTYFRIGLDPYGHVGHHHHIPSELVITLLLCIAVVSLIGNGLVVVIIFKIRRMQTFMNWLILNLAVADLSASLFCLSIDVPYEIFGKWVFGEILCTLLFPLRSVTIFASIFTLMSLSISRYWAITYPFKKQPTIRFAKVLICVIWISSFLLAAPYMVSLKYNDEAKICYEVWSPSQSKVYTISTFVFTYILPLIVIASSYSRIVGEMTVRNVSMAIVYMNKDILKETKSLIKLSLIITGTFSTCLLPYHIVWLLFEFTDLEKNFIYFPDTIISAYLLLYLNSAMNPVNYNVFSENFRDGFRELFRKIEIYFCERKKQFGNNRQLTISSEVHYSVVKRSTSMVHIDKN